MSTPIPFFRSMLGGFDGNVSASRACIFSVFLFIIGVGIGLSLKIGRPISVADYNLFLSAAATFLVTTTAPLYLINKGASVATAKITSNNATAPDAPQST